MLSLDRYNRLVTKLANKKRERRAEEPGVVLGTLAHELGHLKSHNRGLSFVREEISPPAQVARFAGLGLLAARGTSKGMLPFGSVLVHIPELAGEGLADIEAHKHIKELFPEKHSDSMKGLLAQNATYLSAPLSDAVAMALGKTLKNRNARIAAIGSTALAGAIAPYIASRFTDPSKGPTVSIREAQKLRDSMGLKSPVFATKRRLPGSSFSVRPGYRTDQLLPLFDSLGVSIPPDLVKSISEHGGVFLGSQKGFPDEDTFYRIA